MRRLLGIPLALLLLGASDEQAPSPPLHQAMRALPAPQAGRLSRPADSRGRGMLRLTGGQRGRSEQGGQLRWVDPSTEVTLDVPEEVSDRFWVSAADARFSVRRGIAARGEAASDRTVRLATEGEAEGVMWAHDGGVEELWKLPTSGAKASYEVELPAGWALAPAPGFVEVRDERGSARARVSFERAWGSDGREVSVRVQVRGSTIEAEVGRGASYPVWLDPAWYSARTMTINRLDPEVAPLPDGRLLVVGGDALGLGEVFDPQTWTFTATGKMSKPRLRGKAVRLPDGRVMVAGGEGLGGEGLGEAEIYDPQSETFAQVPTLAARRGAAAAAVPGGLLLVGGEVGGEFSPSAERWDGEKFVESGAMLVARRDAAAVALQGGRVLVVGGGKKNLTAELYLPDKQAFKPTGATAAGHQRGRALELSTGDVVFFEGQPQGELDPISANELYDVETGTFSQTYLPNTIGGQALGHRGVTLPDGRTLAVGSVQYNFYPNIAYLFDPFEQRYEREIIPDVGPRRSPALAMLPGGQVAVIGGVLDATVGTAKIGYLDRVSHEWDASRFNLRNGRSAQLADGRLLVDGDTSEIATQLRWETMIFDPQRLTLETVGSRPDFERALLQPLKDGGVLALGNSNPNTTGFAWKLDERRARWSLRLGFGVERPGFASSRLPGGNLVFSGGGPFPDGSKQLDVFLPETATYGPALEMIQGRTGHNQVTLFSGKVLLGGGTPEPRQAELYDPKASSLTSVEGASVLLDAEATLLQNGDVLFSGGYYFPTEPVNHGPWVRYDAKQNKLIELDTQQEPKLPRIHDHRALLLADQRVLIVGGNKGLGSLFASQSAPPSLFDPQSNTAIELPQLGNPRFSPLLYPQIDGRVLVLGGASNEQVQMPIERFDPATLTFSTLAGSDVAEQPGLLTLASGKVLVAGGKREGKATAELQLFDPATRVFSKAGAMSEPREGHRLAPLDDGGVLIVGGRDPSGKPRSTVERYDPLSGVSQPLGAMKTPRADFALLRASDGGLLAIGGNGSDPSVERYDQAKQAFEPRGALLVPRKRLAAVRVASGEVMIAGGQDSDDKPVLQLERYSPGPGTSELVGEQFVPGDARALRLTGGVMFTGDNVLAQLDPADSLLLQAAGFGKLLAAVALPTGDRLLIGEQSSQLVSRTGEQLSAERRTSYAGWASAVVLPDSDVLMLGGKGAWIVRRDTPVGTARPVLTSVPQVLPVEAEITVKGARLARPPWSASTVESASIAPSVFFLPNEGEPHFARVRSWSDDQITFTLPRTPFHGPGRLHVVVDGVRSEGIHGLLLPLPLGAPCGQGSECGVDRCVDGVCCDSPCKGGCESCLASQQAEGGQDGHCGPIRAQLDPRDACAKDGTACGLQGYCDGKGQCAIAVDQTPCGVDGKGSCQKGSCITPLPSTCDADKNFAQLSDGSTQYCAPYRCDAGACLVACTSGEQCAVGFSCASGACRACAPDGQAVLIEGTPLSCGHYRCDAGACLEECDSDQDCAAGYRCAQGACGPYCDDRDEAVIEGPQRTSCLPFRCVDSRCPTSCVTSADCAVGLVCMSDGRCLPPPASEPAAAGCSAAPRPAASSPWAALLAAGLLLRLRRSRAAALAAALVLGRGQARAADPPPAEQQKLDSAKEEFRRGIIFFEAAEYEVALEHFRRSRGLFPSKPNTVNMAVCLDKLGRHDEAIELFEEALSRFAADLSDEDRKAVPGIVAGLRSKVGEIEILSPGEGELLLDGRPRGRVPRTTALRALPGRRLLRVVREGYAPFEAAVEVHPGERARVEVRFQLLDGAGRLRVEVDDLKDGILFVDGSQVGELPWEGSLPPGNHVVQARSNARGSALVSSVIVAGQITLLRLRSSELGPPTRVTASPSSAQLRIDGVAVGNGVWSGQLPRGAHRIELSEEGYRPQILPFDVGAEPSADLAVSLAIDPSHPRWPRPRGGFLWLDGRLIGAIGPTLASGAEQRCREGCSATLASGGAMLGRIGYEFAWGLSLGFTGGYLQASQSLTREVAHPNPQITTRYTFEHAPVLRGIFLAGSAAYSIPMGNLWSLRGGLSFGVLLSTEHDRVTAQATSGNERASTQIPGASASLNSAPIALLPELSVARKLGPVQLFVSLSALFIPTAGPSYPRSSVFVSSSCPPKASPSSVGCTPEAQLLGDQRSYGPLALAMPGLGLRYQLGGN